MGMNTPRTFTITRVANGWLIRLHRVNGGQATPDEVYVSTELTGAMHIIDELTNGGGLEPVPA